MYGKGYTCFLVIATNLKMKKKRKKKERKKLI